MTGQGPNCAATDLSRFIDRHLSPGDHLTIIAGTGSGFSQLVGELRERSVAAERIEDATALARPVEGWYLLEFQGHSEGRAELENLFGIVAKTFAALDVGQGLIANIGKCDTATDVRPGRMTLMARTPS